MEKEVSVMRFIVSLASYMIHDAELLQSHIRFWRFRVDATPYLIEIYRDSSSHVDIYLKFDLFELRNGENLSCEERLQMVQRCSIEQY